MKKKIQSLAALTATVLVLASCGGEAVNGAELAKEVCECTTAANALPSDDPNRRAEQDKCSALQSANWEKVKGDKEQESAFNDQFPCGM